METKRGAARKSRSLWRTASGTLSLLRILAGSGGVLLLLEPGHFFHWEPLFQAIIDAYERLLEVVLDPVERIIHRLFNYLDWNLNLGPVFKPTFVFLMTIWAALMRAEFVHEPYFVRNGGEIVETNRTRLLVLGVALLIVAILIGVLDGTSVSDVDRVRDARLALFAFAGLFGMSLLSFRWIAPFSHDVAAHILAILGGAVAFILLNTGRRLIGSWM